MFTDETRRELQAYRPPVNRIGLVRNILNYCSSVTAACSSEKVFYCILFYYFATQNELQAE